MAETAETAPLFFYGSLQDDDVLLLVLGRRSLTGLDISSAVLLDHAVERVSNHVFPMITPSVGDEAPGRLVRGLSSEEIARIAFFEDNDYERICSEVVAGGARVPASYFVPTQLLQSSGEAWRLDQWPASEKTLLIACAEEQMSYFGLYPQELVETWWPQIEARARARLGLD